MLSRVRLVSILHQRDAEAVRGGVEQASQGVLHCAKRSALETALETTDLCHMRDHHRYCVRLAQVCRSNIGTNVVKEIILADGQNQP